MTLVACHSIPASSVPTHAATIESVPGAKIETRTDVRSDDVDAKDEDVIRACAANDPGIISSGAALDAFHRKVVNLDLSADPTELTQELGSLMDAPCFELADGDLPKTELVFDSALSLQTWWNDGGEAWLRHYLTIGADRNSIVPVSPRKTLTASAPSHPLAPLLCPGSAVNDFGLNACGHETKGWTKRLAKALTREAEARRTKQYDICVEETKAAEPLDRYDTLRACLDQIAPKHDALPIGRFKAPVDGWLVMSTGGRCPNLYAYDLATGSAYQTSGCRAFSTEVGLVGTSALREAAFALMLSGVAQPSVRTENASFELPPGTDPVRRGGGSGISLSGCGGSSSIRTWSWMRGKKGATALRGQVSGTLDMSGCSNDAERYASELIEAMEDAMTTGCAPAPPPAAVQWEEPGPGVVAAETTAAPRRLDVGDAGASFLKARSTGTCTARP